jgi:hypothetical protein
MRFMGSLLDATLAHWDHEPERNAGFIRQRRRLDAGRRLKSAFRRAGSWAGRTSGWAFMLATIGDADGNLRQLTMQCQR